MRFRVDRNARNAQSDLAASCGTRHAKVTAQAATLAGQALNIPERGVYFTSDERLHVGESLHRDRRLPRKFAGRWPEQGRCTARLVRVDEPRPLGVGGFGATVERFEPVTAVGNWANAAGQAARSPVITCPYCAAAP
ncbi:MAG TPA: hypothetical protein VN885_01145 [Candidatus Acidoferrales bacterium]|nr:hypothetical protein [Candidatus Acidoferrales bacterium]